MKKATKIISFIIIILLVSLPVIYHLHYQYTHFINYKSNTIKVSEQIKKDDFLEELKVDLKERELSSFNSTLNYLDDFVMKKEIPLSKSMITVSFADEQYIIGFGFVIGFYRYMFYIYFSYETDEIIEFSNDISEVIYPFPIGPKKFPLGYAINEDTGNFTARVRMSSFYNLLKNYNEITVHELKDILSNQLDYIENKDFYRYWFSSFNGLKAKE